MPTSREILKVAPLEKHNWEDTPSSIKNKADVALAHFQRVTELDPNYVNRHYQEGMWIYVGNEFEGELDLAFEDEQIDNSRAGGGNERNRQG
jgi:hypothetical protein